jgi:hypothetical protein
MDPITLNEVRTSYFVAQRGIRGLTRAMNGPCVHIVIFARPRLLHFISLVRLELLDRS